MWTVLSLVWAVCVGARVLVNARRDKVSASSAVECCGGIGAALHRSTQRILPGLLQGDIASGGLSQLVTKQAFLNRLSLKFSIVLCGTRFIR